MKMQEMIKDAVQSRLGEDYTVEIREVLKNNDTKLTGLTIAKEGQTAVPTLYIDKYVDMTEGELMNAADELVAQYRQCENNDTQPFTITRERILEGAIIRVVSAERNAKMLKSCPHKLLLDLAITYRVSFGDAGDNSIASCLISNQMMESFGITTAELEAAAEKNADKYNAKTIQEIMAELMGMEPDMLGQGNDFPMYVITNKDKMFGATVLAYNDVLMGIADSIGSDLYILPSSVHEVLAVPRNTDVPLEALRGMVPEVNSTQVASDEVLSDSVYMFNRDSGELEVAA